MSPKISIHFILKQLKNVKHMSVFVWTLHIKWLQIKFLLLFDFIQFHMVRRVSG